MLGKLAIREACFEDFEAIMRVMANAFDPLHGEAWTSEQCRASFLLPGYRWLIASSGHEVAGFLLSRTVANESEMMLLAVDTGQRFSGVGRGLVESWLTGCTIDRVERVYFEVRDGNSALEFYRRLGFAEIGRRKAYYSGGKNVASDAITMTLMFN